jgi:E3 ubiquitin-protein ligase EDD1
MERDRILLIQKTFRTLNSYYYRNQNINSSSSVPPLAVQRVKVTFKDEPGEGSGVARSFYSSIVEAILSEEKLPTLELGSYGASSAAQSASGSLSSSSHAQRQQRPSRERRTTLATYLRSDRRSSSMLLSSEARPFKFSDSTTTTNTSESNLNEHWTSSKIKLGVSIYPKVAAIQPFHAEKITGMLLEGLPTPQLQRIINIEEDLRIKVEEAMNILTSHSTRDTQQNDSLTTTPNERLLTNKNSLFEKQPNEYTPLFWQPDKKGVYAPRPGKYTPERLTAYRNVGR